MNHELTPPTIHLTGGLLENEGLEPSYGVLPRGRTARDMIRKLEADVVAIETSREFHDWFIGEIRAGMPV